MLIVLFIILISFLSYSLYRAIKPLNDVSGIYTIQSIYNKFDRCHYQLVVNQISFDSHGMNFENKKIEKVCVIPSETIIFNFCEYNYNYKFPMSGEIQIRECEGNMFQGSYMINWDFIMASRVRKILTMESSKWIIKLSEIQGFTMTKPYIESGYDLNKIAQFEAENKLLVWRDCETH